MGTLHPLRGLLVAVSIAGCGPAPVPEAPAPAPAAPAVPSLVSPARWLHGCEEVPAPLVSRKLPGGGVLHGSVGGERWITREGDAGPASLSSPAREAASTILPERIAGILPVEQRWAFFGVSGRAFLAASPLGPIEEVRPPPAPLRALSAGSAAALAVTTAGELLRSTDGGAHWSPVKPAGLSPAVPFTLALRPDGTGAVLAAPQRGLSTTDDGASWAPLAVPGGGSLRLELSTRGEIWLANDALPPDRTHRLEGQPAAFVAASPPPDQGRDPVRRDRGWSTRRALSGKRVLGVSRPGPSSPWEVQVSELDREECAWKALPELDGCQEAMAAAFDDDLVLGCVRGAEASAAPPAADAAAPAPYRMVFHRSKDGGASWALDGEVPLWDPRAEPLAGPDGWLLVHQQCRHAAAGCTPLVFRTAAERPFSTLETTPETRYFLFTVDRARRRLLAVGVGSRYEGARFQSWSLDGHPGPTGQLFKTTAAVRGAITVDPQGTIVIVAAAQRVWTVLSSSDEGATFEFDDFGREVKIQDIALAGDRGLFVDQHDRFWETASSGKKWVPVTGLAPRHRQRMGCTRDGCAVGPDHRLGWDLATEAAPAPALAAVLETRAPEPVAGATPLRCVAGEAREIGGALLDELEDLTATGSTAGRLVIPAATRSMGVELLVASASGDRVATRATALFGPAPNRAAVGSRTEVLQTSAGVVATRLTYPVDRSGADVWISPVSAEVAWWRPQTGKVVHGRLPPLGKGQMPGTFALRARSPQKLEVLWLGPEGVVYRPDIGPANALFTFTEQGTPTRVVSTAHPSARATVRTPSGLALIDLPSPEGPPIGRFALAQDKGLEPRSTWTLAPPGSAPVVLPLQRGEEGALVVAWSGPPDGPPRGFVVPVRPGDGPAEITDLGLAALLVERPRACGEPQGPAAVRLRIGIPRAVRRVVLVADGAQPVLLRAEAAVVVVPPQGPACVSEWIARGKDGADLAILPVTAPARAWWIRSAPADDEGGAWTRTLEVRAMRCEEAAGLVIPASFKWKGF